MYEAFASFFGGVFVVSVLAVMAMPFTILAFFIIAYIGFNRDINGK
jgi:hypothetical protein